MYLIKEGTSQGKYKLIKNKRMQVCGSLEAQT